MSPRTHIVLEPHYLILHKKTLVTIVDGLVGSVRCGNEILWIQKKIASAANVPWRNWVHVVDDDSVKNISTWNSKIAAVISGDDQITNSPPLRRAVEKLIHVSVKSKGFFSNNTL